MCNILSTLAFSYHFINQPSWVVKTRQFHASLPVLCLKHLVLDKGHVLISYYFRHANKILSSYICSSHYQIITYIWTLYLCLSTYLQIYYQNCEFNRSPVSAIGLQLAIHHWPLTWLSMRVSRRCDNNLGIDFDWHEHLEEMQ